MLAIVGSARNDAASSAGTVTGGAFPGFVEAQIARFEIESPGFEVASAAALP
jgi:hypothetical protein